MILDRSRWPRESLRMRSSGLVALATIVLLLSIPDGARAARPSPQKGMTASKKALINQVLDRSEGVVGTKKISEAAFAFADKVLGPDPRITAEKGSVAQALGSSVDPAAVRLEAFTY